MSRSNGEGIPGVEEVGLPCFLFGEIQGYSTLSEEEGYSIRDGSSFDAWSFTLTETQEVQLDLMGQGGDMDLILLDAEGRAVAASIQNGAEESIDEVLPPGTYVMIVAPFNVPSWTPYSLFGLGMPQ